MKPRLPGARKKRRATTGDTPLADHLWSGWSNGMQTESSGLLPLRTSLDRGPITLLRTPRSSGRPGVSVSDGRPSASLGWGSVRHIEPVPRPVRGAWAGEWKVKDEGVWEALGLGRAVRLDAKLMEAPNIWAQKASIWTLRIIEGGFGSGQTGQTPCSAERPLLRAGRDDRSVLVPRLVNASEPQHGKLLDPGAERH